MTEYLNKRKELGSEELPEPGSDRAAMLERMEKARQAKVKPADGIVLACPVHADQQVTLYISKAEAWCSCGRRLREVKSNA